MVSSLDVKATSQVRLFPSTKPPTAQSTPLSVLDAITIWYSPTQAVWLFDPPPAGRPPYSISVLSSSLQKTVDLFPQWTGSLTYLPYQPSSTHHLSRYNRLQLTWGNANDPGIEFVVAESPSPITSLVPEPEERKKKPWSTLNASSAELFSKTTLAMQSNDEWEGLPGVSVQVTKFADGGLAIGIKLVHPLADAETMMTFMKNWAGECRSSLSNQESKNAPTPLFDPSLIAQRAAGDINASARDPAISEQARKLPLVRFDFWAPSEHKPNLGKVGEVPPQLDPKSIAPFGTPVPWELWDKTAPAGKVMIHITKQEMDAMYAVAKTASSGVKNAPPISHHTAVLAYVWLCLLRARSLSPNPKVQPKTDKTMLTLSVSIRTRVDPPIPNSFLGSPLSQASTYIQIPSAEALSPSGRDRTLSQTSIALSTSLAAFSDRKAVAALLHDMHYADAPQRYWDCFLGERHAISTTWCRSGLYELDFWGKEGGGLRYAEPILNAMDGGIVTYEAGPLADVEEGKRTGHWTDTGIDVMICARNGVLEKLVEDLDVLRAFRK